MEGPYEELMALKFVKRRSKNLVAPKRKIIVERYAAIDQFGELSQRKKEAFTKARQLGHDMLPWHQRKNDPAGRWNSFCHSCNMAVAVCTEAPEGMPDTYGPAILKECAVIQTEDAPG